MASEAGAIAAARAAAARYLEERGYPHEAELVAAGRGDDFAEVRMALALHAILTAEPVAVRKPLRRRTAGEEC